MVNGFLGFHEPIEGCIYRPPDRVIIQTTIVARESREEDTRGKMVIVILSSGNCLSNTAWQQHEMEIRTRRTSRPHEPG